MYLTILVLGFVLGFFMRLPESGLILAAFAFIALILTGKLFYDQWTRSESSTSL